MESNLEPLDASNKYYGTMIELEDGEINIWIKGKNPSKRQIEIDKELKSQYPHLEGHSDVHFETESSYRIALLIQHVISRLPGHFEAEENRCLECNLENKKTGNQEEGMPILINIKKPLSDLERKLLAEAAFWLVGYRNFSWEPSGTNTHARAVVELAKKYGLEASEEEAKALVEEYERGR